MNRKYIIGAAVIALGATAASSQEIATWAGFRSAAANFTFDDGAPSHVSDAGPLFDKYGYKATFNVVVNWNPNWSGFQNMAKNGHEIASHSNTHGQNMSGEEASSKQSIQSKITQDYGCLVVAYPNCNVPNANAVRQNYIAGRICNGSWQGGSDIMGKDGPSDWTKVSAIMTGSEGSIKSTNDFTGQMQRAIQQGGWVAFLTHGFSGKNNGNATYSPTDIGAIEGALQWAKQNDSKIWVTTMRSTVMYIKERNASKITEKSSSGSSITYTLTHNIADNVSKYDYPLSIRVKSSWSKVSATQGGKAIDASIKDGYIYFDAVPNGGDIVLSSDGAAVTPGSSNSQNPSSSASASTPFKGAIAVPGTVEAENYDVDAFYHSNPENEAPDYRSDNAGVVKAGTGYAVGYTTASDYFEYTLDVKAAGKYKVTVNGATGNAADGSVTLAVGSSSLEAAIKSKGDWDTYTAVEAGEMTLAAGKQTLRLTIGSDNLNVDWIKFESTGAVAPASSSSANNPGISSSSGTLAIEHVIHLNAFSGVVKCSVFDLNGNLIKSMHTTAGSIRDLWNHVNADLNAGMYIMRYGEAGKSMTSVRVRK